MWLFGEKRLFVYEVNVVGEIPVEKIHRIVEENLFSIVNNS